MLHGETVMSWSSCDPVGRCGHCKKLEPIYTSVAWQLKTLAPDIIMARVDATVETDLAEEHGITAYPTLKMYRKGKEYDYQGPRSDTGGCGIILF